MTPSEILLQNYGLDSRIRQNIQDNMLLNYKIVVANVFIVTDDAFR
jgi:hypothetical protein